MKLQYYKEQIIETASMLEDVHEALFRMLINIGFDGEITELQDDYYSSHLNFSVEEFYQFDDPVLNRLGELIEHVEKVKTFLEETYPYQENFNDVPDEA